MRARPAEACNLYDAVIYRYSANWYGYLAQQRIGLVELAASASVAVRVFGDSNSDAQQRPLANLKSVTVAAETSTEKELERAAKSDQLSTVGLFDWAIDELEEAKKTAQNSPKINLALCTALSIQRRQR